MWSELISIFKEQAESPWVATDLSYKSPLTYELQMYGHSLGIERFVWSPTRTVYNKKVSARYITYIPKWKMYRLRLYISSLRSVPVVVWLGCGVFGNNKEAHILTYNCIFRICRFALYLIQRFHKHSKHKIPSTYDIALGKRLLDLYKVRIVYQELQRLKGTN